MLQSGYSPHQSHIKTVQQFSSIYVFTFWTHGYTVEMECNFLLYKDQLVL